MSSIALYYPWMHFQDDDWVKRALLTWSGIVRIRPGGVEDRDSDVVRQVRAESDLIVDVTPGPRDLEAVSEAFGQVLGDFDQLDLSRFDVTRLRSEDPDVVRYRQQVSNRIMLLEPGSDDFYWVFAGRDAKMTRHLAEQLERVGLGVRHGEWVGLHPKLGSIYSAALADAVARSQNLAPVTDSGAVHRAPGALDRLAGLFRVTPERPSDPPLQAYLDITINAAVRPASLHHLQVSKLLAFRARHASELAAFQDHLASLAPLLAPIADVESPELARLHLRSVYDSTTKKQLTDLRKALRSFGIDTTVGALGIKVDMGAASSTLLGAAAAAEGHVAIGAAAVALTVLPYVAAGARARRDLHDKSPVSYLLAAERALGR